MLQPKTTLFDFLNCARIRCLSLNRRKDSKRRRNSEGRIVDLLCKWLMWEKNGKQIIWYLQNVMNLNFHFMGRT